MTNFEIIEILGDIDKLTKEEAEAIEEAIVILNHSPDRDYLFDKVNYARILSNANNQLDYLISEKTSPTHTDFMLRLFSSKKINEKDLNEMKGYYNGLKVAKEVIRREIAVEEEMCGIEEEEEGKNNG